MEIQSTLNNDLQKTVSSLIIINPETITNLRNQDKPADCIALYTFYCYTATWQKTNQPKATTNFTAKGLKWSEEKVRKIKKILKSIGLIEEAIIIDNTSP